MSGLIKKNMQYFLTEPFLTHQTLHWSMSNIKEKKKKPLSWIRWVHIHDYPMYPWAHRGAVSCVRHFHRTNLSQALNIIQGHLLGRSFDMLIMLCRSFLSTVEAWRRLWKGEISCQCWIWIWMWLRVKPHPGQAALQLGECTVIY